MEVDDKKFEYYGGSLKNPNFSVSTCTKKTKQYGGLPE